MEPGSAFKRRYHVSLMSANLLSGRISSIPDWPWPPEEVMGNAAVGMPVAFGFFLGIVNGIVVVGIGDQSDFGMKHRLTDLTCAAGRISCFVEVMQQAGKVCLRG